MKKPYKDPTPVLGLFTHARLQIIILVAVLLIGVEK